MRFDDLFREYYLKKRKIRHSRDLDVLPRSIDILTSILMIVPVLISFAGHGLAKLCSVDTEAIDQVLCLFAFSFLGLSMIIVIISTNTSERKLLKSKEVSQKRLDLVKSILIRYNIDYKEPSALDSLLDEVEMNKVKYDYAKRMKIPTIALSSIMAPLGIVSFELTSKAFSFEEIYREILVLLAICLGFFLCIFLVSNTFLFLLNRKYEVHNDLAEDIRQLKLFSSNRMDNTSGGQQ